MHSRHNHDHQQTSSRSSKLYETKTRLLNEVKFMFVRLKRPLQSSIVMPDINNVDDFYFIRLFRVLRRHMSSYSYRSLSDFHSCAHHGLDWSLEDLRASQLPNHSRPCNTTGLSQWAMADRWQPWPLPSTDVVDGYLRSNTKPFSPSTYTKSSTVWQIFAADQFRPRITICSSSSPDNSYHQFIFSGSCPQSMSTYDGTNHD